MSEQVPSIGRIVHFVYGGDHVPAIITGFPVLRESDDQAFLTVFLPNASPFTTVADHKEMTAPGTWLNATWHWPEYVPAKASAE